MADDYVIRGRLVVDYDSRGLERRVAHSMQRIQHIFTGTGNRLGKALGIGIYGGVNSAVTQSNRRIGAIAQVARVSGRLAGEHLARGLTSQLGRVESRIRGLGGGRVGGGRVGGGGGAAGLGATIGSGSGLLSALGGAIGGAVGGPIGAGLGSIVGRTVGMSFRPFIHAMDTATRSMLAMNSSLQQSEHGIASLFSANFGTSFQESRQLSKRVIGDLRHDAAIGVGDERQYQQTYQQLMTPALAAGADLGRMRQLTRLTVGAGALSGREGGMELAGLDILQALSGAASDRTMQVLGPLLKASGVSFEKLNAMSGGDRLKAIEDALLKLEPGMKEMDKTWESRTGAFSAQMRNFALTATGGLFERMNEGLGAFNGWLAKNEKVVNYFVRGAGQFLVDLWGAAENAVRGVQPWLGTIFTDLAVWRYELALLSENLGLTGKQLSWLGAVFSTLTSAISGGLAALNLFVLHLEELFSGLLTMADILGRLWNGTGWIANPFEMAEAVSEAGKAGGARLADIERRRTAVYTPGLMSGVGADPKAAFDLNKILEKAGVRLNFNGPVNVQVKTEANSDPLRIAQVFDEFGRQIAVNGMRARRALG